MTVVTTAEGDVGEAERKVERDLGAIANELDHLTGDVAEHSTTINGLKEDRAWIVSRFEAVERDLAALPRVPEELATHLASLTQRIERLEIGEPEPEEETKPPEDDHEETEEDEDAPEDHARHERRGILNLDAWF